MRILPTLLAAFGLLAILAPLQAAPIYDNGLPNTTNGFSIKGSYWTADDFTLGGNGSIGSVGFYFQNYNGIVGWNQDVDYAFHADNAGSVGALLASGSGQNVAVSDSGLPWCCGGGNAYLVEFDLQSPFAATGGTKYWLKLTNATGPAPSAWWVTANPNATQNGFAYTSSEFQTPNQFAFYLNGVQQVPEPASLAIWGLGAVGCALAARRRRRR